MRIMNDKLAGLTTMSRLDWWTAGGMTLFSFLLSLAPFTIVSYGHPGEKIFDEVYYVRAAEEYLRRQDVFEYTHPPLGKLIVAASMWLFGGLHGFGDTAVGWRFLNVVVGALMVLVIYWFGKRLLGSTPFAAMAAGLLLLDGFHYVQSRIATPEIIVAFFSLLTLYAFYRFWMASQMRVAPEFGIDLGALVRSEGVGVIAVTALALGLTALFGHAWSSAAQVVFFLYVETGGYLAVRMLAPRFRDAGPHVRTGEEVDDATAGSMWLWILALCAGCLAASKWNGLLDFLVVWFLVAIVVAQPYWRSLMRVLGRRIVPGPAMWGNPFGFSPDLVVGTMLFVAATIYALAYIPYFQLGHSFSDLVGMQKVMYQYHSTLTVTHPYGSKWWQWPLILRPIAYYYHDFRVGLAASQNAACCVAEILALPNPIVWWTGLISVPFIAYLALRERNKGYALLVTAYLFQWLPWIGSPRVAFEYHFLPNLAIICLADAVSMQRIWNQAKDGSPHLKAWLVWPRPIVWAFGLMTLLAFVFFFPVLSGMQIPWSAWDARMLHWLFQNNEWV